MQSFTCILFLFSILTGLYAFVNSNGTDDDHETKIINLLSTLSNQAANIDDNNNRNEDKNVVRDRRSTAPKKHKKNCDRNLSLTSTGVGAVAGAGIGAAAGALLGSAVPIFGTAIGALVGNV